MNRSVVPFRKTELAAPVGPTAPLAHCSPNAAGTERFRGSWLSLAVFILERCYIFILYTVRQNLPYVDCVAVSKVSPGNCIRVSLGAGSGHGLFLRKLGRLNVC